MEEHQEDFLNHIEQFFNHEADIPGAQEQIPDELHAVLNSHHQIPRQLYALTDLPPGYRFAPKDEELIRDYLKKKINKEPAPYSQICSVDVYQYSPQELTEKYPSLGDGEWYFFSPMKPKNILGHQLMNRAAGNGCWKCCSAKKHIHDNDILIGFKTDLMFHEGKPPNVKKTNWGMTEYMIKQQQNDTTSMLQDSCVLCRIEMKIP